jgi:hypothetical protein
MFMVLLVVIHSPKVFERADRGARVRNPFSGCVLKPSVVAELGILHGKLGLDGN